MIVLLAADMANASQTRKILLIGVDGCRSDALQQANTPTIDSLLPYSLYTLDSWHTGITISGPSWSSVLTGTNWNKHGVKGNSYAGSNFNSYPYFTKRAKEIKPNLKCVAISEWAPLLSESYNDAIDSKIYTDDGGDSTTAVAIRELQDSSLDVLFAYYEAVDRAGHASGFSPGNNNYLQAIEFVDAQIAILLHALKSRINYIHEDWLILIVTDHGGNGLAHGGNSWSERHIWWLASGAAISPAQISTSDPGTYNFLATGIFNSLGVNKNLMRQSPVQTDIAVTALHHLIYDSGIHPENYSSWSLDGKSWINNTIGIQMLADIPDAALYPNPANESIHLVDHSGKGNKLAIELFDLSGRQVVAKTDSNTSITLDVSGLSTGMYIAVVYSNNQVYQRKLTVVH